MKCDFQLPEDSPSSPRHSILTMADRNLIYFFVVVVVCSENDDGETQFSAAVECRLLQCNWIREKKHKESNLNKQKSARERLRVVNLLILRLLLCPRDLIDDMAYAFSSQRDSQLRRVMIDSTCILAHMSRWERALVCVTRYRHWTRQRSIMRLRQ